MLLAGRWVRVGLGVGAVALLLAPTLGAAEIVARGAGALDTPFEARENVVAIDRLFVATPALVRKTLPGLQEARAGAPDLLAVQSAAVASVFSYPDGDEVLPIGGFTGFGPSPSLDQVRAAISRRAVHLVSRLPLRRPASRRSPSTPAAPDTPRRSTAYCTPADTRHESAGRVRAPVDVQVLPGDVPRGGGGEEETDVGDVVRVPTRLVWVSATNAAARSSSACPGRTGVDDRAGRHRVHGDAARAEDRRQPDRPRPRPRPCRRRSRGRAPPR